MISDSSIFELTSTQKTYLAASMNKVSRSFAVVVPCLEEPLNHSMATAYLLCRVVDNIEDCSQPFAWKQQRFTEFMQLLSEPASSTEILADWEGEPWPGLTPDEKALMSLTDGLMLWHIYARIPEEDRAIIRRWTQTMARGMSQIESRGQTPRWVHRSGVRILADERDYNRYCYVVAGTVGHLATELVINHYRLNDEKVILYLQVHCEACGRGLQKTNIIKDFVKDLKRGVCYLPDSWLREAHFGPLQLVGASPTWKHQVLADALAELDEATDYVLTLPYRAVGYRLAGLMCLLPAYQTLLLAAEQQERLFTVNHGFKISRHAMAGCLQAAQAMVADNASIWRYGQEINRAVTAAFKIPVKKRVMVSPQPKGMVVPAVNR